jgi:hypothetical protein
VSFVSFVSFGEDRITPIKVQPRAQSARQAGFDARNDIFSKKMKVAVESHDQLVCGHMANPVIKLVVISHRETVKVRDFLGRKVG